MTDQTNTTDEQETFDLLLQEFIDSNLAADPADDPDAADTRRTGSVPQIYRPYVHKNIRYAIPVISGKPGYRFRSLTLFWGCQSITSASADDKLILSSDAAADSWELVIEEIRRRCRRNETGGISVSVYREGVEKPFFETVATPDDSDMLVKIPVSSTALCSGNYFLLLGNLESDSENRLEPAESLLRYTFTLLEPGERLEHPRILSAAVQKQVSTERPDCYTSGTLRLDIELSAPAKRYEEYSACCYTRDLNRMGEGKTFIYGSRACASKLKIRIDSETMWIPGPYCILLLHNREPFARLFFSLPESGTEASCSCGPLLPEDPDYRMVKYLEKENDTWPLIREMPLPASSKYKLIEQSKLIAINRLRNEQQLGAFYGNLNFAITGPDAAGRKALAESLAFFLKCHTGANKTVSARELTEPKLPAELHDETAVLLENCDGSTLILTDLSAFLYGSGRTTLQKFAETAERKRNRWSLILTGTTDEVNQIFEISPVLAAHFRKENHLTTGLTSLHALVCLLQKILDKNSFRLSPEAQEAIGIRLSKAWEAGKLRNWTEETVSAFLEESILPRFQDRILAALPDGKTARASLLTTIEADDIDFSFLDQADRLFDASMHELNRMVGLRSIKKNMQTLFNQMCFNKNRKELGFPADDDSTHHMIFTGNPGTGKTTVAKMIGNVYRALGLLSKGEVIVTERSQLVGRYIGETEKNMQDILKQARGNVLFIDEAYTLCDAKEDRKDFGFRAIECLLTVLAQKKPDMLVILAGYEKEMDDMMSLNPGLKGRFPHTFYFEDYSARELMQIAENLLEKKHYSLTAEAETLLFGTISETVGQKDRFFSNARWIEQFLTNYVLPAMSERVLSKQDRTNRRLYCTIEPEDIREASFRYRQATTRTAFTRKKIGFRA